MEEYVDGCVEFGVGVARDADAEEDAEGEEMRAGDVTVVEDVSVARGGDGGSEGGRFAGTGDGGTNTSSGRVMRLKRTTVPTGRSVGRSTGDGETCLGSVISRLAAS